MGKSIKPINKRCAVYTRKSTEEGLDQDFNSLDAQREACENFIASQRSQGWKLIKTHYDDGGISGGHMERPALQSLLADIDAGLVDIIVVYKIDRLTRSLADFAKMVERFETGDVSFVSVTQQFNTSTSMGRLTLNVLLSFAQFEREVTAERIRDKIAASRKKGMWTGGSVPLGYDAIDRKLVINQKEAMIIREIYQLYLETGCVRTIVEKARHNKWRTKHRPKGTGGMLLARGPVYHILSNPVYTGLVRQGEELYPGQHKAIIEQDHWQAVQDKRQQRKCEHRRKREARNPLSRKLFADGHLLTLKTTLTRERNYRHYISHALETGKDASKARWRLRAGEVEAVIVKAVGAWLSDPQTALTLLPEKSPALAIQQLLDAFKHMREDLAQTDTQTTIKRLAPSIDRIDLDVSAIAIVLSMEDLLASHDYDGPLCNMITIQETISIKKRGLETRLILGEVTEDPAPDPALLTLVHKAHYLHKQWVDNPDTDLKSIAYTSSRDQSDASKQIRLAFLAPDIIEAIIKGTQPIELTAQYLKRLKDLPPCWDDQRALLGFH